MVEGRYAACEAEGMILQDRAGEGEADIPRRADECGGERR
jgi:hypothetical protein